MNTKAGIQQVPAVQLIEPQQVNLQQQILLLRGKQVLLDFQLAALYGVSTKVLNQAVRRNITRFPEDFMFQLDLQEFAKMRSQFVTSYSEQNENQHNLSKIVNLAAKRNITAMPYAFTEQGVAMLSSVLRSETAVQMNIAIMRAFVAARQMFVQNQEHEVAINELKQRMKMLEDVLGNNLGAVNDLSEKMKNELKNIYRVLGALSAKSQKPLNPIGYDAIDAERKAKTNKEEDKDSK